MKKIISILRFNRLYWFTTFKIIDKKKKYFNINLLSANKNYQIICIQIIKYKPNFLLVTDQIIFEKVKKKFKKTKKNFK